MNLADPYLKTARAKEHIETLREYLRDFLERKPCRFVSTDDQKGQRCRVEIRIADPPDRINLITGEIFYCLRTSLDQLVWCLAKLTTSYPEHTQFPIQETPDPKRFDKQTAGVPSAARTIIESLQPYQLGDVAAAKGHLLWRLNKMCNIDKHVRIPVHGTTVDFHLPARIMSAAKFDDDGKINIPLSLKSELKEYVEINSGVGFRVVFGDHHLGVQCDFDGIEAIYEFVANRVIPRFVTFFL